MQTFFYYLESPYQLRCALRHLDGLPEAGAAGALLLLRDNGDERQRQQAAKLLQKARHARHVSWTFLPAQGSLLKALRYPWVVLRCLWALRSRDAFVFGDMRSPVFRAVSRLTRQRQRCGSLQLYSVDDGLYLYAFLKAHADCKRLQGIHYITNLPIGRLGPYKVIEPPPDDSGGGEPRPDRAVFIGSKLVEGGLCGLEAHRAALAVALARIRAETGAAEVCYVAHRGESDANLEEYRRLGYLPLRLALPIEEHESTVGRLGRYYYSFYSSALFNLAITGHTSATFTSLRPADSFWVRNRKPIGSVYEMFEGCKALRIASI